MTTKSPILSFGRKKNKATLSHFNLCGMGTTAKLVAEEIELAVTGYLSDSLGGGRTYEKGKLPVPKAAK